MDLKCNKTCCEHNDRCACRANEIHVSDKTCCKTFKKDFYKKPKDKISKTMFEEAPDIAPYKAKSKVDIKCKADCLFNKEGLCNANGITVLDGKTDGLCGTFIEK